MGISRDSVRSQRKFSEAVCLPFPMLCDDDGAVCERQIEVYKNLDCK